MSRNRNTNGQRQIERVLCCEMYEQYTYTKNSIDLTRIFSTTQIRFERGIRGHMIIDISLTWAGGEVLGLMSVSTRLSESRT